MAVDSDDRLAISIDATLWCSRLLKGKAENSRRHLGTAELSTIGSSVIAAHPQRTSTASSSTTLRRCRPSGGSRTP